MKLSEIKETHPNLYQCLEAIAYDGGGGIANASDIPNSVIEEKFQLWENSLQIFAGKVLKDFLTKENAEFVAEFVQYMDLDFSALESFACSEESTMIYMATKVENSQDLQAFFHSYFDDNSENWKTYRKHYA